MSGDLKLGVSRSLLRSDWEYPVHGLRHPPEGNTSGWYCWTGDLADSPEFFVPLHQHHLVKRIPELADCLELAPGTRFLVAPGHSNTWHDPSLLDI